MANRDDCNFLSTRCALRCLNEKVSIFAVVMEVGLPRKSRGTDWYRTMKITDESLPQSGMAVNFFEQSVELLPHVLALGDIIVLCDVRMTHHNGEVFAVFNKKSSSFGLYRGKDGDRNDIFPYQVSLRFLPRHLDLKFIAGLRKWLMNFQVDEEQCLDFVW
uniref:Protection of telomeres 1 protein n=1 Tax=Rhizophora mucronata TaxID=61149 RepID=A0A2P2M0A8_RHIMU